MGLLTLTLTSCVRVRVRVRVNPNLLGALLDLERALLEPEDEGVHLVPGALRVEVESVVFVAGEREGIVREPAPDAPLEG